MTLQPVRISHLGTALLIVALPIAGYMLARVVPPQKAAPVAAIMPNSTAAAGFVPASAATGSPHTTVAAPAPAGDTAPTPADNAAPASAPPTAVMVTPSLGPSVVVVLRPGQSMTAFKAADSMCRAFAQQNVDNAGNAQSPASLQARYDMTYSQCMISRGYQIAKKQSSGTALFPAPPSPTAIVPLPPLPPPPPIALVPVPPPHRPHVIYLP